MNPTIRKLINRYAFFQVGDIQWLFFLLGLQLCFKYPLLFGVSVGQREYGAGQFEDAYLQYFDRRVLEEYGSMNALGSLIFLI